MSPTFETPTENVRGRESFDPPKDDNEKIGRILMRHYQPTARGQIVLKRDGIWETLSSVTQDELDAAEAYYLGGHTYELTESEATELTDAGFEVTE